MSSDDFFAFHGVDRKAQIIADIIALNFEKTLRYFFNDLLYFTTEKDISQRDLKVEYFLGGYDSVTKITDEERRILPMLGVSLYFFYLGLQCQRYDNWSNVFLNETYLKRFINLLVRKYFGENISTEVLN